MRSSQVVWASDGKVLGSIPASPETEESEARQMNQWWIKFWSAHKKAQKSSSPLNNDIVNYVTYGYWNSSNTVFFSCKANFNTWHFDSVQYRYSFVACYDKPKSNSFSGGFVVFRNGNRPNSQGPYSIFKMFPMSAIDILEDIPSCYHLRCLDFTTNTCW